MLMCSTWFIIPTFKNAILVESADHPNKVRKKGLRWCSEHTAQLKRNWRFVPAVDINWYLSIVLLISVNIFFFAKRYQLISKAEKFSSLFFAPWGSTFTTYARGVAQRLDRPCRTVAPSSKLDVNIEHFIPAEKDDDITVRWSTIIKFINWTKIQLSKSYLVNKFEDNICSRPENKIQLTSISLLRNTPLKTVCLNFYKVQWATQTSALLAQM
jgi:hypothetical protein